MSHDETPDPLETIRTDLESWRRAHPRATLTEIEQVVEARLGPLRARLMQDAAQGGDDPLQLCPECGRRMVPRGQHSRRITVAGGEAMNLTRSYLVCPHCQAGFFPPR